MDPVAIDHPPRWWQSKPSVYGIARWTFHRIGARDHGGYFANWLRTDFGPVDPGVGQPLYHAHVANDGFELAIGYHSSVQLMLRRAELRHLVWFILWRWWGREEWFGLRRWLWYKLLHVVVGRYHKPKLWN